MASQSNNDGSQEVTSDEWQTKLSAACALKNIAQPSYQMFSDHRGNRVAWTCAIEVLGKQIPARFWYDGRNVNGAREDAALEAYRYVYNYFHSQNGGTQ